MKTNSNLLDKAISYVSPKWALSRSIARYRASYIDSSYSGASATSTKMQNWRPGRGSANADYGTFEQDMLVSRCRDAHRNQALARAVIERMKHNVVGVGLRLQSHIDYETIGITSTDASRLERTIEREFEKWSRTCDAERWGTFSQLQALALVSMLISGDVFINTPFINRGDSPYGLKIQVIEGDRVCNPSFGMDTATMRRGVELDAWNAPVAYQIMSEHPGDDLIGQYRWDRYQAFGSMTGRRRILHIFEKERPGQVRGVPYLAPVLEYFHLLNKYTDAEITAAVVSSMMTVFVKTEHGDPLPGQTPTTQNHTIGQNDQLAMYPGGVVSLLTGESIDSTTPGRPNANYAPFVDSIFDLIGAALGWPAEFAMLRFRNSYSSARAAILQAWKLVLYYRSMITEMLCQPILELFFDEMVARGIFESTIYDQSARYAYTRASWIGPARGAIDENKEVSAARDRIELGISTRQQEAEELTGMDIVDVTKQLSEENRLRNELGVVQQPQPGAAAPAISKTAEDLDKEDLSTMQEAAQ